MPQIIALQNSMFCFTNSRQIRFFTSGVDRIRNYIVCIFMCKVHHSALTVVINADSLDENKRSHHFSL